MLTIAPFSSMVKNMGVPYPETAKPQAKVVISSTLS
jgi:hypothetical protein